jgi:phosphomannomutase
VVVVGRDARRGSDRFARVTAEVFAAAGFDTRVLPGPLPTPVLAFAVRALGAVAGVQITASHNPAGDNGYKVYLADGRQIVPPVDTEIEQASASVGPAVRVPRSTIYRELDDGVVRAYRERVLSLRHRVDRGLRVALTPLHGVAGELTRSILTAAGHTVLVVPEQFDPDPDFPTVAFPNPEEPAATDALLRLAARERADIAFALDPDGDRCAVGVPDTVGWRMLRGDETGVLLGDYVLSTTDRPDPRVATTIVSSSLLAKVAAARGADYVETSTGFKWLSRAGIGLVYAYEEAIGHCVDPDTVADKDGISTAVVVCDLLTREIALGRTLSTALDDLMTTHGVHRTDLYSVRLPDTAAAGRRLDEIRHRPPEELAGVPVRTEDLLPNDNILRLTGPDRRVMIRSSGTEPILKFYLEVTEPVRDAGDLPRAKAVAADRLTALRRAVAEQHPTPVPQLY